MFSVVLVLDPTYFNLIVIIIIVIYATWFTSILPYISQLTYLYRSYSSRQLFAVHDALAHFGSADPSKTVVLSAIAKGIRTEQTRLGTMHVTAHLVAVNGLIAPLNATDNAPFTLSLRVSNTERFHCECFVRVPKRIFADFERYYAQTNLHSANSTSSDAAPTRSRLTLIERWMRASNKTAPASNAPNFTSSLSPWALASPIGRHDYAYKVSVNSSAIGTHNVDIAIDRQIADETIARTSLDHYDMVVCLTTAADDKTQHVMMQVTALSIKHHSVATSPSPSSNSDEASTTSDRPAAVSASTVPPSSSSSLVHIDHQLLYIPHRRLVYSLAELYGIDEESPDCVVCLSEAKCIILLPCRHVCVCETCYDGLHKCPICRSPITEFMRFEGPAEAEAKRAERNNAEFERSNRRIGNLNVIDIVSADIAVDPDAVQPIARGGDEEVFGDELDEDMR